MSRLTVYLTVSLLVLFGGIVLVIRAQPCDDSDMRALLMPDDCAPPCFMGIRPGQTDSATALDILEHHPWVKSVEPHYIGPGTSTVHLRGWVYWDWKADAPIWFRASPDAMLGHAGAISTLDGVVEHITITTNIPFGRLRLMLGKPPRYGLSFSDVMIIRGVFQTASIRYRDDYLQNDIQTQAVSLCRNVWNLWFDPGYITFFSASNPPDVVNFSDNRPFLSLVRELRPFVCSR